MPWRGGLLAALVWLLAAGSATAATISFDYELDTGAVAPYASASVTPVGGDLLFEIEIFAILGPLADLHQLYFNLADGFSGLAVSTTDAPQTPYTLNEDPPVNGGAGLAFDWGVSFGNGAGPSGNGRLTQASFLLSADQPLGLAALLISSGELGGLERQFAIHVQSTDLLDADSEAIAGSLPEPALLWLVAAGLAGLLRRRAS